LPFTTIQWPEERALNFVLTQRHLTRKKLFD